MAVSLLALLVAALVAMALGTIAGLVWRVANRNTRSAALGVLGIGGVVVAIMVAALLTVRLSRAEVSEADRPAVIDQHQRRMGEARMGHGGRHGAEAAVPANPSVDRTVEVVGSTTVHVVPPQEIPAPAPQPSEYLETHRGAKVVNPSVGGASMKLAPVAALGVMVFLVLLVAAMFSRTARPVVLGILGLVAVLLVISLLAPLAVRRESIPTPHSTAEWVPREPIRTPVPLPPRAAMAPATPVAADQDISSAAADDDSDTEGRKPRGLLQVVGRAIGKAVAEEKEKKGQVAVAELYDAPPAPAAVETQPPDWVGQPASRSADGAYRVPVAAGPYKTRDDCEPYLAAEYRSAVDDYVVELLGHDARWHVGLPPDYVAEHVVKDEWEEWREFDRPLGQMVKLHKLLVFDGQTAGRLEAQWQQTVTTQRVSAVAAASVALLLVLATVFAYLKIDLASSGAYRGRLRLGLCAALVALALIVMAVGKMIGRMA